MSVNDSIVYLVTTEHYILYVTTPKAPHYQSSPTPSINLID